MRLVGYCTGCHKVRSVRVPSRELARLAYAAGGGVANGICSDCEREEEEERAERAAQRTQR